MDSTKLAVFFAELNSQRLFSASTFNSASTLFFGASGAVSEDKWLNNHMSHYFPNSM